MTNDQGILLVGHGTRDARGQAEFREAAMMLRERMSEILVVDCFLELATPDIAAGVDALVQTGVQEIVAAPLLLFSAGHAKRDIPAAIEAAVRRHDGLSWKMAAPLGEHPAVLKLAAKRFHEAPNLQRLAASPESEEATTLVFVSRGSSDAEAIAAVHQFFDAHRSALNNVTAARVCFLAAAKPKLEETLHWAMNQSPSRIVVQPHLLFHGQLMEEIREAVAALRSTSATSGKEWRIADYLGPSPEIIDALVSRIGEAME